MFGNISRVDFDMHDPVKGKPRCNWFDEDDKFLERADKLPTYGRSYMAMFMKMVKTWTPTGKKIRRVKTPEMVDAFCDTSIQV